MLHRRPDAPDSAVLEQLEPAESSWVCNRPVAAVQRLEITTGELLPDQEIPLLKSRRKLSRAEALKLWEEKRKAGWAPCSPQW